MMRTKFKSLGKAVLGLSNRGNKEDSSSKAGGGGGGGGGRSESCAASEGDGRSSTQGSPEGKVVGEVGSAGTSMSVPVGPTPNHSIDVSVKSGGGGAKGLFKKTLSSLMSGKSRASSMAGSSVGDENRSEVGSNADNDMAMPMRSRDGSAGWNVGSAAGDFGGGVDGLVGLLHEAKLQVEFMNRATKLRARFTEAIKEVRGAVLLRAPDLAMLEAEAGEEEGESVAKWGDVQEKMASVSQAVSVARSDIVKANGAAALNVRAAKTKASVSLDALDVARLALQDAIQEALPEAEEQNSGSNGGSPPNRKSVPNSTRGEQVRSKAVHTTDQTTATATTTVKTTGVGGGGGGDGDGEASRRCVLGEEKLGLADKEIDAANNYASARRHFEVAAKGGDARGQLRYGQCLAQGLGGVKDEAEGRLWMTRSAVQGDEEAECEVAAYTERTKGVEAAVPLLRSLASKNNTGACLRLADAILDREIEGDEAEAEVLLIRAGELGDAPALNRLAIIKIARGEKEAGTQVLERSALMGYAPALNNLGVLHEDGGDAVEAALWYSKAAALGHADAINNLGFTLLLQGHAQAAAAHFERAVRMASVGDAVFNLASVLEHGSGCSKDVARAGQLYMQGAKRGCSKSAYRAACLLYDAGEMGKSGQLMRQAAAKGHPQALNALGVMVEQGLAGLEGGMRGFEGARGLYEAAAQAGCADGAFNMGLIEERVGRRVSEARRWYHKAHEMGHGSAISDVVRLDANGGLEGEGGYAGLVAGGFGGGGWLSPSKSPGGAGGFGGGGVFSDPYSALYDRILKGEISVASLGHSEKPRPAPGRYFGEEGALYAGEANDLLPVQETKDVLSVQETKDVLPVEQGSKEQVAPGRDDKKGGGNDGDEGGGGGGQEEEEEEGRRGKSGTSPKWLEKWGSKKSPKSSPGGGTMHPSPSPSTLPGSPSKPKPAPSSPSTSSLAMPASPAHADCHASSALRTPQRNQTGSSSSGGRMAAEPAEGHSVCGGGGNGLGHEEQEQTVAVVEAGGAPTPCLLSPGGKTRMSPGGTRFPCREPDSESDAAVLRLLGGAP